MNTRGRARAAARQPDPAEDPGGGAGYPAPEVADMERSDGNEPGSAEDEPPPPNLQRTRKPKAKTTGTQTPPGKNDPPRDTTSGRFVKRSLQALLGEEDNEEPVANDVAPTNVPSVITLQPSLPNGQPPGQGRDSPIVPGAPSSTENPDTSLDTSTAPLVLDALTPDQQRLLPPPVSNNDQSATNAALDGTEDATTHPSAPLLPGAPVGLTATSTTASEAGNGNGKAMNSPNDSETRPGLNGASLAGQGKSPEREKVTLEEEPLFLPSPSAEEDEPTVAATRPYDYLFEEEPSGEDEDDEDIDADGNGSGDAASGWDEDPESLSSAPDPVRSIFGDTFDDDDLDNLDENGRRRKYTPGPLSNEYEQKALEAWGDLHARMEIQHFDDQNLYKIGRWLGRRWRAAVNRLDQAENILKACGFPISVLEAQWKAQLAVQLERAPRQSKNAGDKAIEQILLDEAHVDELQSDLSAAQKKRKKVTKLSSRELQHLTDVIEEKKCAIKVTRQRIALAKAALGTGALRDFNAVQGDAYIRARVNARALRTSIRMAVRAHKFEREKLERNYRRQVMQHKDHAQTRDLVHSREKNLSAMVRKYNGIVNQIELLLKQKKAPRRGIQAPRRLDAKKLFRLDVDDEIWQEDPGLGPQDEGALPAWQVDKDVRDGIRTMLEANRCREEVERLAAEASALLVWWKEEHEWSVAMSDLELHDDLI